MAEADLDVVIRQIAKAQNKTLMAAARKRHGQIMARAAKAKTREGRDQLRAVAKGMMELGAAAAKRLLISAENTADSYARAIKNAEAEAAEVAAKAAEAAKKAAAAKKAKAKKKAG